MNLKPFLLGFWAVLAHIYSNFAFSKKLISDREIIRRPPRAKILHFQEHGPDPYHFYDRAMFLVFSFFHFLSKFIGKK